VDDVAQSSFCPAGATPRLAAPLLEAACRYTAQPGAAIAEA
jgi:hypothetical protein